MKEKFFSYIGEKNSLKGYTRSYKLVFLIIFFENMNKSGQIKILDLVNSFKKFYTYRINNGLIADKNVVSTISDIDNASKDEILNVILKNPYRVINQEGFMEISSNGEYFTINSRLFSELTTEDIRNLLDILYNKIKLYFQKIDEMIFYDFSSKGECDMSHFNISGKIDEIVSYFTEIEHYYREERKKAIMMDDDEASDKLLEEIIDKIKRIKNIKTYIQDVKEELNQKVIKLGKLPDIFDYTDNKNAATSQAEQTEQESIPQYTPILEEAGCEIDGIQQTTLKDNNTEEDSETEENSSENIENLDVKITLLGQNIEYTNTDVLLQKVCNRLILYKPYEAMRKLPNIEEYITSDIKRFTTCSKLNNGLYLKKGITAAKAIQILNLLKDIMQCDDEEFIIK